MHMKDYERGVLPGLIAGYIFLAYAGPGMSDVIGSMFGSGAFIGFVIHLIVSMVIGSLYISGFTSYLDFGNPLRNVLFGGLMFGLLWWVVGWNIILPAAQGADILQLSLDRSFYAHIMFGQALAYLAELFDASMYFPESMQSETDGYGCAVLFLLLSVATIALVISKGTEVVAFFGTVDTQTFALVLLAIVLLWAISKGVAGSIWAFSISALEHIWHVSTTVAEILRNAGNSAIVLLSAVGTLVLDLVHLVIDTILQSGDTKGKRKSTRTFENSGTKMVDVRETSFTNVTNVPQPAEFEKAETSFTTDPIEIPVFGKYKGHTFKATLLLRHELKKRQKIIRFRDTLMTASASALKAVNSINPSVNSWSGNQWWHLYDAHDKRERPIADLFTDVDLLHRLLRNDYKNI